MHVQVGRIPVQYNIGVEMGRLRARTPAVLICHGLPLGAAFHCVRGLCECAIRAPGPCLTRTD